MRILRLGCLPLLFLLCSNGLIAQTPQSDRDALEKTDIAIRAAFSAADVSTAMRYHHPEVRKALTYNRLLIGLDAVAADLQSTFQQFHLDFVENQVESLLFEGDTAIEQTLFTIRGTPLHGGTPFLFKGRSMIVYIRYKESPTGWATIREIIQPATN